MGINLSVPDQTELKPKILVLGVGGAGGNAVNNMIRSELQGVEFVVANTDAQALKQSLAADRIQLGAELTEGLGAGSKPQIGASAAEEALDEVVSHFNGVHMCFITAGMGGGTGTGAAPVVARAARELGILTVGVVTKPFQFEGNHRMRIAEAGIEELQKYVDTLIIIPNQNLFRIANEKTTFADAFNMADDVLHSGVRGVTDLMVMPGLINLDFADVNTVMNEMGKAMMGTGEASGENRAIEAAEAAISNPLLDDVSMKGARGVLINITGGMDLTLYELDEAANRIRSEVDPEANIIVGSTFNPDLDGTMRVSVVATGIDGHEVQQLAPNVTSLRQVGGGDSRPTASAGWTGAREAPSIPEVGTTSAMTSGFGASVPEVSMGQPMMSGETESVDSGEVTYGTAEASVSQSNLALDTDRDLLTGIEGEMEPSEQALSEPEGRDEPFRAPPVIKVEKRAEDLVNPAASRSAEEAAQPRKRRKGPSLFERMTGVGRLSRKTEEEKSEPRTAPQAQAPVRQEPAAPVSQPAAQPEARPEEALSSSVRIEQKQEDEDLLDIPAFLRRQAN
ncbi:cell division protein FtsZ [Sneathiella chinensis]|uniref:Cell division protein FtsZ n=1 Tax=Sneathiella chinensis TaxID=349750 RepID=A0ABQ5U476_9PROT|nr:cell division protein FtsZ [Sneathiella chinensis]GLQ06010.1 cell division protein FtsZ [Sneathiella chinensis]